MNSVMDWSQRRVLVTGGTGLVGAWLVRALVDSGAYTTILIRDWDPQSDLIRSGLVNRVAVVSGALEDFTAIERALVEHEADTIFHLAAQTIVGTAHRNPLATFESNIRGTYNLLEVCRRHSNQVRSVVIASSDKAYGECHQLPYREDMPPLGRHPYDVSKACTDLLSQTYAASYHLPVGIVRCGNIYGGGDLNWSRIVPGTVRSLLRGEAPVIRSDGKFLRDYIYVEDVASAYLLLAQAVEGGSAAGQAFNFSPEQPISVLEIVKLIQNLIGRTDLQPIILNGARGEIRDQYLSCEKAATRLAWKPHYALADGLRRTIAWYTDYFGAHKVAAIS